MATIQRPLKEGSVRTYQEKVGLGFLDILASEVDADLETIYGAWNGGADTINLKDGAVTTAKLADGAVHTADLADLAVTTSKLGDLQVTLPKLAVSATLGVWNVTVLPAQAAIGATEVTLIQTPNIVSRGGPLLALLDLQLTLGMADTAIYQAKVRIYRNNVERDFRLIDGQAVAGSIGATIPVGLAFKTFEVLGTGATVDYKITIQRTAGSVTGNARTGAVIVLGFS